MLLALTYGLIVAQHLSLEAHSAVAHLWMGRRAEGGEGISYCEGKGWWRQPVRQAIEKADQDSDSDSDRSGQIRLSP